MKCASIAFGLLLLTGCTILNPITGKKEYDPIRTEQVKAALEPVAAGAIRRIIFNSPQHSDQIAEYFRSIGKIFCQMDASGEFSPETLIAEVDKLTAPLIGDVYIIDIKNALLALYRINYADRFRAELPPDKWPRQIASLFCGAIDRGLKDAGKPGSK